MGQGVDAISTVLNSVDIAASNVTELQGEGEQCLADLRRHIAASKTDEAGTALACINRSISGIAGQDVLSSIERSLRNLTSGIVVPSAIRTPAQKSAVAEFLSQRQAQADRIADQIAAEEPVVIEPLTMQRESLMKGIILHWSSIIPQIATAASIDLLPLVLLVFQTLRSDDQRTRGRPRQVWTADDLEDALRQIDALRGTALPVPELDLPDGEFIDLDEDDFEDVSVDQDEEKD